LNNNKITEVKNSSSLVLVEELDLRSNRISSLESFHSLENLKWLSLSSNNLTSLQPFPRLERLEYLGLFANFLKESDFFSDVLVLSQLCPSLSHIFVEGNQLPEPLLQETLENLKLKNKTKIPNS
jgi:hypothetical protein